MVPKIAIVGLQHQGLILAVCFASMGYRVVGVDDTLENFNENLVMLKEPGLEKMQQEQSMLKHLHFTTDYKKALADAEFIFLSYDIQFDENGVDVEPIYSAATEINYYRESGSILCVTTQVPVGTTETLTGGPVVYIPELLRPGQSIKDFMNPDRIVIGTNDAEAASRVSKLFWPLSAPVLIMNLRSAEMVKHAHNAMLATQISFANEIARICKQVGADPMKVVEGVKFDHRVGRDSYVNPGWTLSGGHLIRDVRVLQSLGYDTPLLDAVVQVEEEIQNELKR
jgi:UDPglucose 6-dehydrogenase